MRRGKEQRRGAGGLRGAVSRSDDDELPALRLVDTEQRGGERRAEEHQVLPAVPLRRLQQSLHKDRQSETSSAEVRRVPGVLSRPTGEDAEAPTARILLQSVWQNVQKTGYSAPASAIGVRRQRD